MLFGRSVSLSGVLLILHVQLDRCVIAHLQAMGKPTQHLVRRLWQSTSFSPTTVCPAILHPSANIRLSNATTPSAVHFPTPYLLQPTAHHHTFALRPPIHPATTRNMSSDADYASFLDKANQDTGSADATHTSSSKKSYGTQSVNTTVPQGLAQVQEYYTSEADEPFEPVALAYEGESLGAGMFCHCIGVCIESWEMELTRQIHR